MHLISQGFFAIVRKYTVLPSLANKIVTQLRLYKAACKITTKIE